MVEVGRDWWGLMEGGGSGEEWWRGGGRSKDWWREERVVGDWWSAGSAGAGGCRHVCMVRLGPRPLSFRIGVPLSSSIDSLSRVTSSSHVASPCVSSVFGRRLSSHVVVVWRCQWVVVLGVWGFVVWSRRCVVVGWWGIVVVVHVVAAQHSPAPMPARGSFAIRRRPGAANEVSEVGGDDDRVATHIPQRPRHVRGVGAPLVRYRACTVVLGLQTRLVRWGVDDDGWPLTFPSAQPRTWHGRSTRSLPCLQLCPLRWEACRWGPLIVVDTTANVVGCWQWWKAGGGGGGGRGTNGHVSVTIPQTVDMTTWVATYVTGKSCDLTPQTEQNA